MGDVRNVLTGDHMKLTRFLKHIGNDNSGATAVEYGLICALIVLAMLAALNGVADITANTWDYVMEESVAVMG